MNLPFRPCSTRTGWMLVHMLRGCAPFPAPTGRWPAHGPGLSPDGSMHFYGQKARFSVCLEDQLFSHVVIPSLLHHFIRLPGSDGVHNVLQHENLGLNQRHFASSCRHTCGSAAAFFFGHFGSFFEKSRVSATPPFIAKRKYASLK